MILIQVQFIVPFSPHTLALFTVFRDESTLDHYDYFFGIILLSLCSISYTYVAFYINWNTSSIPAAALPTEP